MKPAAAWHHNAVKTHCKRGHPFDEANTYRRPDTGHRQCRRCKKDLLDALRGRTRP